MKTFHIIKKKKHLHQITYLQDNATNVKKDNSDINGRYISGSTEHKKSTGVDEEPRVINLAKPKTPIKNKNQLR